MTSGRVFLPASGHSGAEGFSKQNSFLTAPLCAQLQAGVRSTCFYSEVLAVCLPENESFVPGPGARFRAIAPCYGFPLVTADQLA